MERLGVLCYWGGRRANDMGKDRVEGDRSLLGEVLDVLLEITVVDGEEAQVVVLEEHPIGEVQRPNRIRRFIGLVSNRPPLPPSTQRLASDLMDMYVSKVPCDVLPVKPAARAHALMSCTEASS